MPLQSPRPLPTPADVLARHKPLPAAPAPRLNTYDRHLWEEALLASVLPHHAAIRLAWGLAHLAGPTGHMPPDTTRVDRLAKKLGMTGRQIRLSLQQLEQRGLISRPDITAWEPKEVTRPITLTLPHDSSALRDQPPSTGGRR